MALPVIPEAPLHRRGYYEARPRDLLGRTDVLVVDIRDEDELIGPVGHIEGVCHLAADDLSARGATAVPGDRPLALVCARGDVSAELAEALVQRWGRSEVYVLVGGMNRWTAEECPVTFRKSWKTL